MSFNKGFNGGFDLTFLKLGNDNTSDTQWVARLDGVTQYWQLSEPILIFDGYKIEFTFINYELGQSNAYLLCANDSIDTGVFTSITTGYLSHTSYTAISIDVDGMGQDVVTFNGDTHMVTCDVLESGSFQKLCSRFNETRMLSGWIKDLTVKNELGEIIHSIPLTNKAQGATQLATVGNVNATMVNYTGDEWEKPQ